MRDTLYSGEGGGGGDGCSIMWHWSAAGQHSETSLPEDCVRLQGQVQQGRRPSADGGGQWWGGHGTKVMTIKTSN